MPRRVRMIVRRSWRWLLTAALWAWLPSACALAAPPPTLGGVGETDKSYVLQYFLVGLCIALGMLLLCRPKARKQEVERVISE